MARLLIREAHGGETRIIGDGALPYFLNQGYVVLDTLDDTEDASPLYLSKAEGDLRWAKISDLGDPESAEVSVISEAVAPLVADSEELRATFGRGVLNAADYGWSTSNAPADNDSAIAAAIADAKSQARPLFLGFGTYQVSAPIDMRASASYSGGVELFGVSREKTIITNVTDTAELLQVGGFNLHLHDFTIRHGNDTPGANTGGGLVFYKAAYSTFKRLQITNTGRGVAIAQQNVLDPGTSTGTANWMFSCTFEDINVLRYSKNGLFLNAVSGRATGSIWNNTYVQNVSTTGQPLGSSGNPVDLYLVEETVFNQLNIEDHSGAGIALQHNAGGQVVINNLHIERVHPVGFNPSYVRAYGNSGLLINGFSLSFSDVAPASTTGSTTVFSVAAGGQIEARGLSFNNVTKTRAATYTLAEVTDTTAGNSIDVGRYVALDAVAFTSASTSTSNPGMKRIGDTVFAIAFSAELSGLTSGGTPQTTAMTNSGVVAIPLGQVVSNKNLDTATNANAITIPAAADGKYLISGVVKFTGATAGIRDIILRVNGTTRREVAVSGSGNLRLPFAFLLDLAANSVVSLAGYVEAAGVSVDAQAAADVNLTVLRIGAA